MAVTSPELEEDSSQLYMQRRPGQAMQVSYDKAMQRFLKYGFVYFALYRTKSSSDSGGFVIRGGIKVSEIAWLLFGGRC